MLAAAGPLPPSVVWIALAPWDVTVPEVPSVPAQAAREEAQYVIALCATSVAMPRPISVAAIAPTDPVRCTNC